MLCHRFWQYILFPKGINHDPNPNIEIRPFYSIGRNNIKIRMPGIAEFCKKVNY